MTQICCYCSSKMFSTLWQVQVEAEPSGRHHGWTHCRNYTHSNGWFSRQFLHIVKVWVSTHHIRLLLRTAKLSMHTWWLLCHLLSGCFGCYCLNFLRIFRSGPIRRHNTRAQKRHHCETFTIFNFLKWVAGSTTGTITQHFSGWHKILFWVGPTSVQWDHIGPVQYHKGQNVINYHIPN